MRLARTIALAALVALSASAAAGADISRRALDWLAGEYGIGFAAVPESWQQTDDTLAAKTLAPGLESLLRCDDGNGLWVDVAVFDTGKLQPFQAARTALYAELKIDAAKDYVRFSDPQKTKAASGQDLVSYDVRFKRRAASGGWSEERYASLTVLSRIPESKRGLVLVGAVGDGGAPDTHPLSTVLATWAAQLSFAGRS